MSVLAAELAQRFEMLRQINEMTAERDRAIIQRDQARRELRVVTIERDEARSLGRCA